MPVSPGSSPPSAHSAPLAFPGRLYDACAWGISPHPGAVAVISDFDPMPGDPTDALGRMSIDGERAHRVQRLCTVSAPGIVCMSRFVPDAQLEEGLVDEGAWPRMVRLCGEERIIGQDEWDLYKMSDRFKCLVRREPRLTSITEVVSVPQSPSNERSRGSQESPRKQPTHCRPPPSIARRVMNEQKKNEKRRRAHLPDLNDFEYESSSDEEVEDDEADEDEVIDIIGDPAPKPTPKYMSSEKIKMARAKKEEDRKKRRERIKQKQKMQEESDMAYGTGTSVPWADMDFNFARQQRSKSMGPTPSYETQKTANMKRKEPDSNSASDEDDPRNNKMYEKADKTRRHRTLSPKTAQKAKEAIHKEHRRRRAEERQKREKSRKAAQEREFMRPLYEEAARAGPSQFGNYFSAREPSQDFDEDASMADEPPYSDNESIEDEPHEVDEEAIRKAALEESIRKMRELEKDRPLWEEAARKRRIAEEAEERRQQEAKRQQDSAKQRERDAEERRRREETARKAREEAERQRQADSAQAEKERQRAQLRTNLLRKVSAIRSRKGGRWLHQDAVEWYRAQCDVFDKTKYRTTGAVIVFEGVPWPTLAIPGEYDAEAITWESTEAFFKAARSHMLWDDYVSFVAKSAVRFHPDRWTAKGVLDSVDDCDLAERYKSAAVRVAKIVNHINSTLH